MHDYKKLHERELNKNGNRGKLVMHGYTILPGGDLNENENLNIEIIYFIFWDRRINVILFGFLGWEAVFFCGLVKIIRAGHVKM